MTTSTTPKKVVSVDILHLDDFGYGPEGKHTRRQWRAECRGNLLAGKAQFEAWQDSWQNQIKYNLPAVMLKYVLVFDDGSAQPINYHMRPYCLDFVGQRFNKDLIAIEFSFKQTAYFSGATFTNNANFSDATFTRDANFKSATFTQYANFNQATFTHYANFNGATFTQDAFFNGATFTQDAIFRLATFNQQCRFDNYLYEAVPEWTEITTFSAKADFESAILKNVGHFEGVKFTNNIPSFLGVDTASTRLEFSDDTHFAWHDVTEDAVKRLGHLKRLADEQGQIDQSLTFNALELHAKAAQPTASLATKCVTGAYAVLSDYGRSFTLPIFWLIFLLWMSFLFGLINAYVSDPPENFAPSEQCVDLTNNFTISKPRAAFEYAMFRASGVLDFTDADKQNNVVNCQLFNQPIEPWWMRAWGIFKAIASLALLFLAALGLRNNYRIK